MSFVRWMAQGALVVALVGNAACSSCFTYGTAEFASTSTGETHRYHQYQFETGWPFPAARGKARCYGNMAGRWAALNWDGPGVWALQSVEGCNLKCYDGQGMFFGH